MAGVSAESNFKCYLRRTNLNLNLNSHVGPLTGTWDSSSMQGIGAHFFFFFAITNFVKPFFFFRETLGYDLVITNFHIPNCPNFFCL